MLRELGLDLVDLRVVEVVHGDGRLTHLHTDHGLLHLTVDGVLDASFGTLFLVMLADFLQGHDASLEGLEGVKGAVRVDVGDGQVLAALHGRHHR